VSQTPSISDAGMLVTDPTGHISILFRST